MSFPGALALQIAPLRSDPPLSNRSDDELMGLASAGNREAYETLVRRHQRKLRAYCGRACGAQTAGDDVAQECFVEIWQRRSSYEPRGKFTSYLFRVAANRCKNARRKRGQETRRQALGESSSENRAPDEIANERRRAELERLLDKLPSEQREAIVLRYSAELDYREIADLVGAPEPTIRTRVFSGLTRLRKLLKIERPT